MISVCSAVGRESKRVWIEVNRNIPEEWKVQKGSHEALCNPILQAELLAERRTELNVIVGLCVGHDSLFMRHSKAPVTP